MFNADLIRSLAFGFLAAAALCQSGPTPDSYASKNSFNLIFEHSDSALDINTIATVNSDGTGFTSLRVDGHYPVVAPDRSKIAFTAIDPKRPWELDLQELFVMNADRTGIRQLTHLHENVRNPSWSPGGDQIIFEVHKRGYSLPDAEGSIYVIDASGANSHQLTDRTGLGPVWSPVNGGSILFSSKEAKLRQIFSIKPDGSHLVQLTHLGGNVGSVAWSPDSKLIAFSLAEKGKRRIYTMEADTSNMREILSSNKIDFLLPRWSPDGRQLLVVGLEVVDKLYHESISRLYVVDLENKALHQVPIPSVYHASIYPVH